MHVLFLQKKKEERQTDQAFIRSLNKKIQLIDKIISSFKMML